jgi:lysophospholipase L1-like esterase
MQKNKMKPIVLPIIICIVVLAAGILPIILLNLPKNEDQPTPLIWASYGDSITNIGGWQEMVVADSKTALQHHKFGRGGTTITGGLFDSASRPAMSYPERLNGVIAVNPDIVTIFGGMNDITYMSPIGAADELTKPVAEKDTDTFIGGYSWIIETLLEWKPSLKIVIIITYDRFAENTNIEEQENIQNATRAVIAHYGLPYIDGDAEFTAADRATHITEDGLHLTSQGKVRLAGLVVAKFESILS